MSRKIDLIPLLLFPPRHASLFLCPPHQGTPLLEDALVLLNADYKASFSVLTSLALQQLLVQATMLSLHSSLLLFMPPFSLGPPPFSVSSKGASASFHPLKEAVPQGYTLNSLQSLHTHPNELCGHLNVCDPRSVSTPRTAVSWPA